LSLKGRAGACHPALGAGEPRFLIRPSNIKAPRLPAIMQVDTKYTAPDGTPALKRAICAKSSAKWPRLRGQPVTVGTGGKQVLINALMATIEPGDEVRDPRLLVS